MSNAKATTDQTFDADVLQAAELVLVDFWAEWCGPCKMIAPVLDKIAEHYGDKLTVFKVNVDENNEIGRASCRERV